MKGMELKAYEILKDKLGEEKAATMLGFVEEKIDEQKKVFLTKDDKMELIRMLKEDKMDLIKWMVGFWIAQTAAILGLYLKR